MANQRRTFLCMGAALLLGIFAGISVARADITRWSSGDCKAIASGDHSYCTTEECKGVVRRDASYCSSNDCKGWARMDYS